MWVVWWKCSYETGQLSPPIIKTTSFLPFLVGALGGDESARNSRAGSEAGDILSHRNLRSVAVFGTGTALRYSSVWIVRRS